MGESSGPQMWLCLLHVPFLHEHGWGPLATHSVPGPGLGTGVSPRAQDGYCHTSSQCVHRGESLPNGWERENGYGLEDHRKQNSKKGEKSL